MMRDDTQSLDGVESSEVQDKIREMRWRCRRGILEVELLLQPFFERHAKSLVTGRLALLESLLSCSDTDLMAWLTQGAVPEDKALALFVEEIIMDARKGF